MTTEKDTLEWAARWIEDSLKGETNERVIEFGKNMAMTLRAATTPATATSVESLLRDPVKVDVSKPSAPPPLIVSRDGVPCADQAAALEEFKERCRASRDDKVSGCVHGVPICDDCQRSAATSGAREAHCWHCGVVLANAPKLRCEDCPDECDVEGCGAMGCAPSAVPVEEQSYEFAFDQRCYYCRNKCCHDAKAHIAAISEHG